MTRRARAALAQVPLLANLSPRHLKRLADASEELKYMEGASIVREGEPGDAAFVILEGEAKVVRPGGRVIHRLLPGDFFGEISLLDGGPRTATVVAETPMTLLGLDRAHFRGLIENEPSVAVNLLQHCAAMLRRAEHPTSG